MLDVHATPEENAEADRLSKISMLAHGAEIHDLIVSCYTTAYGEDGRPEDIHERRLSDGSCRCGHIRPRHVCPDPAFHKSECPA